jgi:hypothetical protein
MFPLRRNGFYRINGEKFASVTTILGVINKPALVHWGARTAASLVLEDPVRYNTCEAAAGGIYGVRDRAADRGSLIHSIIEALSRGADVNIEGILDHARGYVLGFLSWWTQVRPVTLFSEATVLNTQHHYAGTTDMIFATPSDKSVRLLDVKTSGDGYREVSLQIEAYRRCDKLIPHVGGNPARPIEMPPVTATMVLLLREDGTFRYEELRGDFEAFLAAKRLWEWHHTKGAA